MATFVSCRKNTLPSCSAPFVVRSSCSSSRTVDEFNGDLASANAGLCLAEVVSHGQLQTDELARQLCKGVDVHLEFGSFHVGASGTMQTVDDPFSPEDSANDHALDIRFRVNRDFKKRVLAGVEIERAGKGDAVIPLVRSARAVRTNSASSCLRGELVKVEGERLFFDQDDPSLGLFFLGDVEIRASYYVTVKSSEIIAEVPEGVPKAKCILIVRTYSDDDKVRDGRLQDRFTVE